MKGGSGGFFTARGGTASVPKKVGEIQREKTKKRTSQDSGKELPVLSGGGGARSGD